MFISDLFLRFIRTLHKSFYYLRIFVPTPTLGLVQVEGGVYLGMLDKSANKK